MSLAITKSIRCVLFGVMTSTLLPGCMALDSYSPVLAGAIDAKRKPRSVLIRVEVPQGAGLLPIIENRVVTAEPVVVRAVPRARATTRIQGVDTIILGESCALLRSSYSNLLACAVEESTQQSFGAVEVTAITDRNGEAGLELYPGAYRVSVKSWPSAEDPKCSWGGAEILPVGSTVLHIPVLKFCE